MLNNQKTVTFTNTNTHYTHSHSKISITQLSNSLYHLQSNSGSNSGSNPDLLPPIDQIIWGKGFISMIGVSWADECN
jgi:hypothetical protein